MIKDPGHLFQSHTDLKKMDPLLGMSCPLLGHWGISYWHVHVLGVRGARLRVVGAWPYGLGHWVGLGT
ncbi:hypothetical protein XENTR_v10023027 [Xenopus tropicalis]|nr:hypothetical protein XENTR_v10023027 [Xenopus tropicalis]